MVEKKRKKGDPHNIETVMQILQLFDQGTRTKDISKKSKEIFGYKINEIEIHETLKRNNRLTTENIKKMYNIVTKKEMILKREILAEKLSENEIPFSNIVPPHNVYYGFPL